MIYILRCIGRKNIFETKEYLFYSVQQLLWLGQAVSVTTVTLVMWLLPNF